MVAGPPADPAPPRAVVCADLEGIAGVDDYESCFPSWRRRYDRARELMEGEVNAVVAGLRDAGVEDIVVTDWHFAGINLRRDRVDAPVRGLWVHGQPTMSATASDGTEIYGERDLAIFVGMHGAAGSDAFMAHTFWQGLACEVDGVAVNEAYLWSTMVGAVGARVGLVAGEAAAGRECQVLLPGVPVTTVKQSVSRDRAATTRRVEDVREELRQAAADAVGNTGPPMQAPVGREVRVTFQEASWATRAARDGVGHLDGPRTIVTALDRADGLIPLLAACTLAMPGGRETQLYTRLARAPEYSALPPRLLRGLTACVHGVGWPLMRKGVRDTQRMDQSVYPAPPGDDATSRTSLTD
ncbi:MAG: M55 family metallopeptidase [Nitriliruptorales bacterium]|nr:M55 family metallopeptidase [Nitriliruptorales bacterium]